MSGLLTQLRGVVVGRLRADDDLVAALADDPQRIMRRPRTLPAVKPLVTYFDFGGRPDATVPWLDRTWQFDVWATDVDVADEIGEHLKRLLDPSPRGNPPQVPGLVKSCLFRLIRDADDVVGNGDLARLTQEYRLLAYDLRG